MAKKLLIDNNLSYKLKSLENQLSAKILHVFEEGLGNSMDKDIWEHAKNQNMVILTKDTDFKNYSSLYDCPPKVIHLRCGNRSTEFISRLIISNKDVVKNFMSSSKDCYLEII